MKNEYGVFETNKIQPSYHDNVTDKITRIVDWKEKGLKIIRLRLLSDIGFPVWDVSYCHGKIGDEFVEVQLPFSQIPKRGFNSFLINEAKKSKVYAKGLGLLDPYVISKLC